MASDNPTKLVVDCESGEQKEEKLSSEELIDYQERLQTEAVPESLTLQELVEIEVAKAVERL